MSAESAASPSPYLFELELPDGGPAIRWRSVDEAKAWMVGEKSAWDAMLNGSPPLPEQLRNKLERFVSSQFGPISKALSRETVDFKSVRALIVDLYTKTRFPRSGTRRHSFFMQWANRDRDSAMAGLGCLLNFDLVHIGVNGNPQLPGDVLDACIRSLVFETGGFDATAFRADAANDVVAAWNKTFDDRRKEHDRAVTQIGEAVSNIKDAERQWVKIRDDWRAELAQHIQNYRVELDSIKKLYRDELPVRTAVDYWVTRKETHENAMTAWGRTAIAFGIFAFLCSFFAALYLGEPSAAVQKAISDGSIDSGAVGGVLTREWIGSIARLAVLTLFLIWPLRIFVRNYLSNSHLAADAAERAVIVQTYLAILNDPELRDSDKLKEQLLPPVLQNIFRHAADGIVKDDAWPWQTIVDAIKQKAGG